MPVGSVIVSDVAPIRGRVTMSTSAGFSGQERVSEHLERPRVLLAAGIGKAVAFRSDLDLDEPGLFKHMLPARARQATGNSRAPQIDVAHGRLGYRLAIGNIGELEPAAGAEHPKNF